MFVNEPKISQNSFVLVKMMYAPRSQGNVVIRKVARLKYGMSVFIIEHSLILFNVQMLPFEYMEFKEERFASVQFSSTNGFAAS